MFVALIIISMLIEEELAFVYAKQLLALIFLKPYRLCWKLTTIYQLYAVTTDRVASMNGGLAQSIR